MASGGKGFGTERARLAGDGLLTERTRLAQGGYRGEGFGTERARLAQGGYRGQGFGTERARLAQGGFWVNFIKEIPLNEISEKLKILLKNVRGGQFSKRNPFK